MSFDELTVKDIRRITEIANAVMTESISLNAVIGVFEQVDQMTERFDLEEIFASIAEHFDLSVEDGMTLLSSFQGYFVGFEVDEAFEDKYTEEDENKFQLLEEEEGLR